MKKIINNQRGFIIPIIIAIVAIFAIGGVVYFAPPKQVEELVVITPNLPDQVATTTITTKDWKTYKNEKYGFEFKYPVSYSIVSDSEYVVFRDQNVKPAENSDDPGKWFSFKIKKDLNIKAALCDSESMCNYELKDKQVIGVDQIVTKYIVERGDSGFDSGFLIQSKDFLSIFETSNYGTKSVEVRADLQKIVSTLKFTTPPIKPAPATSTKPVACTMDAMMCPDGSYFGRTGPKCEFVCPNKKLLPKGTLSDGKISEYGDHYFIANLQSDKIDMGKLPYKLVYSDNWYKIDPLSSEYFTINQWLNNKIAEDKKCADNNICISGPYGFYIDGFYLSDHVVQITDFKMMTQ